MEQQRKERIKMNRAERRREAREEAKKHDAMERLSSLVGGNIWTDDDGIIHFGGFNSDELKLFEKLKSDGEMIDMGIIDAGEVI
jgi:hypothetical protein